MNENKSHNTTWQWRRTQLCKLIKRKLSWKWTVTIIFPSPKSLRKNKVKSCDWSVFLILEDKLFGWRNFSYFDLISHSYRDREDNFHTREFSAIFKFDDYIFTEFILDFNNRRIKLYDIRSIEFRLSFFKSFKDVLMYFFD